MNIKSILKTAAVAAVTLAVAYRVGPKVPVVGKFITPS